MFRGFGGFRSAICVQPIEGVSVLQEIFWDPLLRLRLKRKSLQQVLASMSEGTQFSEMPN